MALSLTFAMPAWLGAAACISTPGRLQKEGSGDEYEVVYDGFTYTVSFNVAAPTSGNDIGVIGVKA